MNFRSRPNSKKRDHYGPGRLIHRTYRPRRGQHACGTTARGRVQSSRLQTAHPAALHCTAERCAPRRCAGGLCEAHGAEAEVEVWVGRCADRVPASKGTEAVSTWACKVMGRACARGSAHLRTKRSSSRRHLRRADVQSGQRSPLCSSARQYGQGRPEHRTGTRTGQVRLYAWRGHRTCMRMENPCSPARQGRADVSPEHGLGGRSRPALRCSPQISGTRDGPVGGAKYVSLRQTLDMDMPGKPRALQAIIRKCAGQSACARLP